MIQNIFIIERLILLLKYFLMGNYRRVEVIREQDLCIWTTLVLKGLLRN